MRKNWVWVVVFSAVITASALYFARKAKATASNLFVSTTLSLGRFSDIDVGNGVEPPNYAKTGKVWFSVQKTKALSDLYVQSNVWQPGGTTGWHTHPGHSLITVVSGTVTEYEGDDPNCTPHVYTVGQGFLDAGGKHTHIIRNEGTVEASTIAVQLIPADAVRRIDADDPGNCHFSN